MKNEMKLEFISVSQNESFARATVAAFVAQLDPLMDELTEIKTVVSEAVTNSIIHGYESQNDGKITVICTITDDAEVEIKIQDEGKGIQNIEEAKQPLYTSKPDLERSGMGFTIMESFMDSLEVISEVNKGTTVIMKKQLTKSSKTVCH